MLLKKEKEKELRTQFPITPMLAPPLSVFLKIKNNNNLFLAIVINLAAKNLLFFIIHKKI
jgi:hypothetical protein